MSSQPNLCPTHLPCDCVPNGLPAPPLSLPRCGIPYGELPQDGVSERVCNNAVRLGIQPLPEILG